MNIYEKIKNYKYEKKILFSRDNFKLSFYKEPDLKRIIGQKHITYADLLLMSQEEFSKLDLVTPNQFNTLKEVKSLFHYFQENSELEISKVKEIHFFDSPDFIIYLDNDFIIGLEVMDISVKGAHEYNEWGKKLGVYNSSKKSSNGENIEDVIKKHLLRKGTYITEITKYEKDNFKKCIIHFFLFCQDVVDECSEQEIREIVRQILCSNKSLRVQIDKEIFWNSEK